MKNYAFLSGALRGSLEMVPYTLQSKGLIAADKAAEVEKLVEELIKKADKLEEEYSNEN